LCGKIQDLFAKTFLRRDYDLRMILKNRMDDIIGCPNWVLETKAV